MGQVEELAPGVEANTTDEVDNAWAESLREVIRQVIFSLPDHATLGELIEAAKSNRAMAPVLQIFTVQELIDTAKKRPKRTAAPKSNGNKAVTYDAEGNPVMDLGEAQPKVIRRRADVPDGDIRVLRSLSEKGAQREMDLCNSTGLTAEQLRIILRHLRTKGYLHIEGSGLKRRYKITRHGSAYLRKHGG